MIARLFKFSSGFWNVPDRVVIQARAENNFSYENYLYAELPLPDEVRVVENQYGEELLLNENGEIIEAYAEKENIAPDGKLRGKVTIYGDNGILVQKTVTWW